MLYMINTMNSSSTQLLSNNEIQAKQPNGWQYLNNKLERTFEFDSYQNGVDFTVQIAKLAEQHNHHPDLHLLYKRVRVVYVSHDVNGVTNRDLRGATAVNALLSSTLRV